VLEILGNVGRTHPKVLADRAPVALCTGFGDSAPKYQLRVWTRLDDAELLQSQLATGIRGALAEAKIEIPFPQRELHIRNGRWDDHELPIVVCAAAQQALGITPS
jgi:potassium-dependent mechanosensitive channel